MTDPLSLTEAKRLAGTRRHDPAARDAHRRPRDADRRLPAPRRRHHARLPARVRRGRRAAGPLQLPGHRAAAAARGRRRRRPHDDPAGQRRRLLTRPAGDHQPRCRTRSPRSGPSSRSGASLPTEGMPRFTGGAVGALVYDAIGAFEPSVPRPDNDPVGVPLAASSRPTSCSCSTTSATSCRRSPRCTPRRPTSTAATGSPSGRSSRRSSGRPGPARPRWRRPSGGPPPTDGAATEPRSAQVDTSPRPRRVHPGGRAREGRDRGRRGDPGRPRPAPVVRPARRRRRHADRRHRPLPRPAAGQPVAVPVLHPDAVVRGRRREPGAPAPGRRATGMTTHPIAGTRPRGATPADDDRLADELRGDPKERAEHVMLVDLGRNDLGRVARAGHRDHQPVHGGRALQPRPPPREPRRGEAPPGAGRARRAARRVPRGHADRARPRSARCS